MKKQSKKNGYGLVEIVVGSAIIATVLASAVFAVTEIRRLDERTTFTIRANYLLLEAVDVIKIFRDNSWTTEVATLSLDTPYYLVWESSTWNATTSQNVIDGTFYRTVTLSAVNRDGNDNIASVGTLDTGTLKVTATAAWSFANSTTTKTFETYVTDLYGN